MHYPVLLHIDIQNAPEKNGVMMVQMRGLLFCEPRVGGKLQLTACGNVLIFTFNDVAEDVDMGLIIAFCNDVPAPEHVSAEELADSIEETLAKRGWVSCDDEGVPV